MSNQVKPQLKGFATYLLLLVFGIIAVILFFSKESASKTGNNETEASKSAEITNTKTWKEVPKMQIDINKKYKAQINTTKGVFTVEFFTKETPITVNNFLFLANQGFYNGTVFHRIIKDFMIQGGDPKGDGSGGPGYTFANEKIVRDYKRGMIAMANRGPDTNGSQFFIMHKDNNLPKNYVIFGQVTEGLDVIDQIAGIPTVDNGQGEKSKPTESVKIEKIAILENKN